MTQKRHRLYAIRVFEKLLEGQDKQVMASLQPSTSAGGARKAFLTNYPYFALEKYKVVSTIIAIKGWKIFLEPIERGRKQDVADSDDS